MWFPIAKSLGMSLLISFFAITGGLTAFAKPFQALGKPPHHSNPDRNGANRYISTRTGAPAAQELFWLG
ncbi:MAG: hypothetical protein ABSG52_06005 [Terriglobales bacterium]